MDIKDRIKMIMDHEQMTAAAFAESIGVAQATISHTLGDRNKYPSTDFIMRCLLYTSSMYYQPGISYWYAGSDGCTWILYQYTNAVWINISRCHCGR